MKTKDNQAAGLATVDSTRPADFPIGSPHSRAAARKLAEEREIASMQDWITVTMGDLKRAKAFARKLRGADPADPTAEPVKVRIIVRTHKTRQQAETARNRDQPRWDQCTLVFDNEEQGVRLTRLFAQRHTGVLIYVDVSMERAGRK
jgi:hypothetical protein